MFYFIFQTKASEDVEPVSKKQNLTKTKKSSKVNILTKSKKSKLNKNECDICAKKFKLPNRLAQHKYVIL